MILETYEKQPAERKDYDIDYAKWLGPSSDTLDEVTVVVVCLSDADESPAALECDLVEVSLVQAKFWMSGGTANARYKLTATATTIGGRVDESELIFKVKER